MNTTLGERIRAERLAKKMTQTELGKAAGVGKSSVCQWEKNITKNMNGSNLVAIAKVLGLNPDWLAEEKGEKYIRSSYNNLDRLSTKIGVVPLLSHQDASRLYEANNLKIEIKPIKWLPCPVEHGKNTFALEVTTDTMISPYPGAKSYLLGSIIFVDPDLEAADGCRVIAKVAGYDDIIFREFRVDGGKRLLKALNIHYPIIEMDDNSSIYGVVVGQFLPE